MSQYQFHDEYSLAELTDQLGKQALKLGLIPSLTIRYFADCREYYIPNELTSQALSIEQAYLLFKRLLDSNQ